MEEPDISSVSCCSPPVSAYRGSGKAAARSERIRWSVIGKVIIPSIYLPSKNYPVTFEKRGDLSYSLYYVFHKPGINKTTPASGDIGLLLHKADQVLSTSKKAGQNTKTVVIGSRRGTMP